MSIFGASVTKLGDFIDRHYLDVDQHPHYGLATLTYLLEGELVHRDSLGTEQRIQPGAVNWMIAGSGVTHTERSPQNLRKNGNTFTLHGYQIWVALPQEEEATGPAFFHFEAERLPQWEVAGLSYRLLAGKAWGQTSPVPVSSDLYMLSVRNSQNQAQELELQELTGELAVAVVQGSVQLEETTVEAGNLMVAEENRKAPIQINKDTALLIFGGAPLPEPRYLLWNFVSANKQKLQEQAQRWREKDFPPVLGDDTYIPLPED